jgi:hypothetical protein
MRRLPGIILFLILATVLGCGQGDKAKYANVKGKVTYNGTPIEKGQITFAVEGQPPSSMNIENGAFNGQAMVGSNKVSVSAKKHVATAPKLSEHAQSQIKGYMDKFKHEQGGGSVSEYDSTAVEYIPPEWGQQSKEHRVVEAGQNNEFEFNITGKN